MNSRLGKVLSRGYVLGAVTLVAALAVGILVGARSINTIFPEQASDSVPATLQSTPDTTRIRETYSHLPLIFEQNNGQSDPRVKFLTHGSGYGLFLTGNNAVLSLHHRIEKTSIQQSVLSMTLAATNRNFAVTGENLLLGKSNYFIGNDPSKWQRDVPQYAGVRFRGVYPGIDLVYHGNQGRLEYDFEIAPGAEPSRVAMRFDGATNTRISDTGDLVLSLPGGDVVMHAPRAYQRSGAKEELVASGFALNDGTVSFVVGNYDRSRTLVIDPILSYSTYLGGSGNEACTLILGVTDPISGCPAVAVDPASNAYIAGSTESTNFPIPVGSSPFQGTLNGTANIFIAKFNSTATTEEFATYIGGSGVDTTSGIAVDQAFNVIVSGNSSSPNFPTSTTAFQTVPLNTTFKHTVVSKVDPTGHTLLYSTYLSGNGTDNSTGVALDPSGNIYVTGTTASTEVTTGFPSTIGAFQSAPAASSTIQFFMTKIAPNLSGASSVPYSTYFGGGNSLRTSGAAAVGGGIAVDLDSNVYITGGTSFLHIGAANDFPILNAYQGCLDTAPSTTTCPNNVSNYDIFVAKINPAAITGTQLIYSTYVGGTEDDIGFGIAVDSSLNAYVTGSTASGTGDGFPTSGTDVFQSIYGGGSSDAFLVKLANPVNTGNLQGVVTLAYSSYLGGSGQDVGLGIAVDTIQGARITGWTASNDFPTPNDPIQSTPGGANDAFGARIDTSTNLGLGAPGNYGTYLGGSNQDYGTSIAVDPLGASYVAGETQSKNFPTTAGVFQPNISGASDVFLSKLSPVINLGVQVTPSPFTVGVGNQATFTFTVTNSGDSTSGITFTDFLPSTGATFVSATSSPGTCGAASGGQVLCNIGTMNSQATATVTVILVPTAGTSPATGSVALTNSGSAAAQGFISPTAVGTVTVNDFTLTVAPSNATVPAGVPANLTATLTPTGAIPDSVSISCSGLPTGATCTETTNPIPNLNQGPASTALVISTTMRVTTVTQLLRKGEFYAALLPLSGLTLLGVGIGGSSRKRRLLAGVLLAGFFSLMFLQAGCGSKSTSTTTGTPAGTYIVTVTATSGQATRTVPVTLVVQ